MAEDTSLETPAKEAERTVESPSLSDRMHLKMISLIHDHLYASFVNPNRWLKAAGLASSQVALEVGCGPGFFTIPAAEAVGKYGHLYSLDINPAAVLRVRRRVEERGLTNVEVIHADAAATSLPEGMVDVAFLFGVLRSIKDLDAVLREMHRLLKENGVLAVQKSGWPESRLLSRITGEGLFRLIGRESGIYRFQSCRSGE